MSGFSEAGFQDFHDLLREFSAYEAIGTDDVVAAILPLMGQVAELHDFNRVAPLDGVEALRVDRGHLWFERARAQQPSRKTVEINRVMGLAGALDIGAQGAFHESGVAPILTPGEEPEHPGFLKDYRSWEHALGHHDPLTDIFSLGMIGASLATGLDLTEAAQLEELVANRTTLTQLNPRLHPIVAQLFERMTELDRRQRAQDLPSLVQAITHHRRLYAATPIEEDAERASSRMQRILMELRARLYDMSRRNRLLYHKPSSTELNLTDASAPVVLRVEAIRPDQLFTWTGPLAERIAAQQPLALGEYIRFEEMAYARAALEKIRAQARKDRTEFGTSQLRLVIAFLGWRNLKDEPEEPIRSPLLLLPVELKKRRGVRDSFELIAATQEAEVNPTLRRCLKLLYDVELPRTVDLRTPGAIDALHGKLREQIARSEPGVRLEKIDKAPVKTVYQRARRRVDVYRRRVRAAGPGMRRYGPIAYSYARQTPHPLGVQLFERYVAPSDPPPPPSSGGAFSPRRTVAAQPQIGDDAAETATAKAAEDARPDLDPALNDDIADARQGGPYHWNVDLCSVTLGNFNYRKMSLVRDFDALIDGAEDPSDRETPQSDPRLADAQVFDQLFASTPKPLAPADVPPPYDDRHVIVRSDPTQDAAVHRARSGGSYVIQGPPGTGKSQTIVNLIADFLGRGKRVLFVCEKRAALDVVYHRLEALGLHRLCALVHDSQEDKKAFIQDLKGLYEQWVDAPPDAAAGSARTAAVRIIERELGGLLSLDSEMIEAVEGEPAYELLAATAAHRGEREAAPPALSLAQRALLPRLDDWRQGREAAEAVEAALRRIGGEPILARHPARFMSAEIYADPDLFERVAQALTELAPALEAMSGAAELVLWDRDGEQAPLSALFAQIEFAHRLAPIAAARKLSIFDATSFASETFRNDARWLGEAREALNRAQIKTRIWRDKLSPVEAQTAYDIARRHEGGMLSFLSSAWRQVKTEVTARAGLDQLAIRPSIRDMLADLLEEHQAQAEVDRALRALGASIGASDGEAALALVAERDANTPLEGAGAEPLMNWIVDEGDAAAARVQALAKLKGAADRARDTIQTCFEGLDTLPSDQAFAALSDLEIARDALPAFAPALRALSEAPPSVRAALRRLDLSVSDLDAAVRNAALDRALTMRPALREASGAALDERCLVLQGALDAFQTANANLLIEAARQRFIEHLALTNRLDLELSGPEAQRKKGYLRARQDLDRELSKSTRFRSVRELMAGPAGLLLRDLKPIWLMSPLSVADALPLDASLFDVAIFDEASQVPVEEAAPTLFRAPQLIVVGDEKQLPPTRFFGSTGVEDDEMEAPPDDEEPLDLDADSVLGQAAKTLPSTLLGWHYRSRAEELISFSNAVFYGGKLISVPSVGRPARTEPIIAEAAEDGAERWRDALARPISFHHTPFADYEKQRNRGEAAYIAELVRGVVMAKTGKTLGVVAFSEAQQSEIERALEALARDDEAFREALEIEQERELDGQFAGLFVKNLENVQGDERDMIFVSVCYGPDRLGRMRMNFGPINRAGGEKRLNVIFSRAKEHIALVSTIKSDAITNDHNVGALCLKTYLRYAEAGGVGDVAGMRRALAAVAPHMGPTVGAEGDAVAEQIAGRLRERGYWVETRLGQSRFVCDVAVRQSEASPHEIAVLVDGAAHYANRNLVERHVTKPSVLTAFGWRPVTVLTIDWRRDPEAVLARIEAALTPDA